VGFYATSPCIRKGDPPSKNRVWRFFAIPNKSQPANRLQAPEPRRKNRPTSTRIASGLSCWPSRDPIGERGGVNPYGFVYNCPTYWIDHVGGEPMPSDNLSNWEKQELWRRMKTDKSQSMWQHYQDIVSEREKGKPRQGPTEDTNKPNSKCCDCLLFFLRRSTDHIGSAPLSKGSRFGKKRRIPQDGGRLPVGRLNRKGISWTVGSQWKDTPECNECREWETTITVQIFVINPWVDKGWGFETNTNWNGDIAGAGGWSHPNHGRLANLPAMNNPQYPTTSESNLTNERRSVQYRFTIRCDHDKTICIERTLNLDHDGRVEDLPLGTTPAD